LFFVFVFFVFVFVFVSVFVCLFRFGLFLSQKVSYLRKHVSCPMNELAEEVIYRFKGKA